MYEREPAESRPEDVSRRDPDLSGPDLADSGPPDQDLSDQDLSELDLPEPDLPNSDRSRSGFVESGDPGLLDELLRSEVSDLVARLSGSANELTGDEPGENDGGELRSEVIEVDGGRTERAARQLAEETEDRLADIEHALTRLDEGSYGRCEVCGRAIEPERLSERPSARRCALHVSTSAAPESNC